MTKSRLIRKVSEKLNGLTKDQTEIIVDTFFQTLTTALENDEKVEIRGFGKFSLRKRAARSARNPRTGTQVRVPGKKVIHFKTGRELNELLNSKFQ